MAGRNAEIAYEILKSVFFISLPVYGVKNFTKKSCPMPTC
jgi:hypothetical protein